MPGPVENLGKTEVTETSIALGWEEPEDDGGCDVTNYVIERREPNRASWNNAMSSRTTGRALISDNVTRNTKGLCLSSAAVNQNFPG